MQVPFNIKNDTLSKSLRQHRLYSLMISILYKSTHIEKDLLDFTSILRQILSYFAGKNFTSCIGGFFPLFLCESISKMYNKFTIDIPLINSILAINGLMGIYYKEIIELALHDICNTDDKNNVMGFPEKIELNRIMCEQFPYKTKLKLSVYLSILRIDPKFMVEIYNYQTKEYISDEIGNILNREEETNKEIEWNDMSVYFN